MFDRMFRGGVSFSRRFGPILSVFEGKGRELEMCDEV